MKKKRRRRRVKKTKKNNNEGYDSDSQDFEKIGDSDQDIHGNDSLDEFEDYSKKNFGGYSNYTKNKQEIPKNYEQLKKPDISILNSQKVKKTGFKNEKDLKIVQKAPEKLNENTK